MKSLKPLLLIGIIGLMYKSYANDTTVTLQNGVGDYTGCIDSYIGTNTYGASKPDFINSANYGNETELKVHRESC